MLSKIFLFFLDVPPVNPDPSFDFGYGVGAFFYNHAEACIAIISAIVLYIFIFGNRFGEFSTRLRTIEKRLTGVESENKSMDSKLDLLIGSFNGLLIKLASTIQNLKGIDDLLLVKTSSPLHLTERGIKILQESGLQSFIDTNKDELMKKVDLAKPQTDYDIEKQATDLMILQAEDPRLNPVKEYAYKNGINLTSILMGGGVYLRDLIIKKEPKTS